MWIREILTITSDASTSEVNARGTSIRVLFVKDLTTGSSRFIIVTVKSAGILCSANTIENSNSGRGLICTDSTCGSANLPYSSLNWLDTQPTCVCWSLSI